MARLKRAANDPVVLREAAERRNRIAVAAAAAAAAVSASQQSAAVTAADQQSAATAANHRAAAAVATNHHSAAVAATNQKSPAVAATRSCLVDSGACTTHDESRPPGTPVSTGFDSDSSATAYQAPRLIDLEADSTPLATASASDSASPASSTIDLVDEDEPSPLSEFRARHIARVADQRARRRRNPPPRNRTVYTCRPCARTFTSRRQLSFHQTSGRHDRAVNRLHDLSANLHCRLCDLPFSDRHNFGVHNRSRIHFRNARREREARLN